MADDHKVLQTIKKARLSENVGNIETIMRQKGGHAGSHSSKGFGIRSATEGDLMDIDDTPSDSQLELLAEFDRRRKARQITVPTDDLEVKAKFRQLEEPICLFGEGPADRRTRLRDTLSRFGDDILKKELIQAKVDEQRRDAENITWYHEGADSLRIARYWLAKYSLPRSLKRLKQAREESQWSEATKNGIRSELNKRVQSISMYCSQVGDERPLSFCNFNSTSELLATGSWSGLCKLWKVPDCTHIRTLRGHGSKIGGVVFRPGVTLGVDDASICLASCDQGGAVKLWDLLSDEPIADIEGHSPYRVSRLAFHPSSRFLATCCFDNSWRLWDLGQLEEILHQEGHGKPVYDICFQKDGSLALTGGMDGFGRVWDLRSGRCIMFLEGHLKAILSVDFSPNGYHMATGSDDHTARIWDLRQRRVLYTIPAHNSLVSRVCFQPNDGQFLLTTSYDGTCKMWSHPMWSPLMTLAGHENHITSADISSDLKYIATSSHDRTFKLWCAENQNAENFSAFQLSGRSVVKDFENDNKTIKLESKETIKSENC